MSSETPNQGEEAVCALGEVPGGEGNWARGGAGPPAGRGASLPGGDQGEGALGAIQPARLGSAPWVGQAVVLAPASLGL